MAVTDGFAAGATTAQPIVGKDKSALADSVVRRIHFILKMVNSQQEHVPVGESNTHRRS